MGRRRAIDSQGTKNGTKTRKKRARLQDKLPDRLSNLPEPLIVRILSSLEMKDAVKTGILSKRWKLLWTQVDSFVYDFLDCISKKDCKKAIQELVSFVDYTLMQSTCLNIKRFSLLEVGIRGHLKDDKLVHHLFNKWISFVLERNVEEITLELEDVDYSAPQCLYRSSSLVTLVLQGVEYLVPPRWTSLKSLSLGSMLLEDESIANILAGCPVLENLYLDGIDGFNHLSIMSPSVKRLELSNIQYRDNEEGDFLKITAPWIQELNVRGLFLVPQCQLVDVSSVENVTLNFYWGTGTADYYDLLSGYDYNLWWINMVMDFLKILCKVNTLTVGSEVVQALAVSKLRSKTYPVFTCKYLSIFSPLWEYDIYGIACLLQSTPSLETLCITVPDTENHKVMYYTSELFDGLDLHRRLPEGKLKNLKHITVNYSSWWCRERWSELDDTLVEYVLKNSCILEKLVITSSYLVDTCNRCWTLCAARYAHQLASKLFKTFVAANENFEWELKKSKSRFEFSFKNYVPLVPKE